MSSKILRIQHFGAHSPTPDFLSCLFTIDPCITGIDSFILVHYVMSPWQKLCALLPRLLDPVFHRMNKRNESAYNYNE